MATITPHGDMWSISIPLDKSSSGDNNLLTLTYVIAKQGGDPEKYDCTLVDIELKDNPKIEGMEFFFKATFQTDEDGLTTDKDDNTWSRDKVSVDDSDDDNPPPSWPPRPIVFTDLVLKAKGGAENKGGQQFMAKAVLGELTLKSANWED